MPHKDRSARNANRRKRAAELRLHRPANEAKSAKRPGKTPFASFIKVDQRSIRRAGEAGSGLFYLDLVLGPLRFNGAHYDANVGSLHISTCKDERRKPKLNGVYVKTIIRPLVIQAIEKWVGDKRGTPYRFPKANRFLVPLRKTQRLKQHKEIAA